MFETPSPQAQANMEFFRKKIMIFLVPFLFVPLLEDAKMYHLCGLGPPQATSLATGLCNALVVCAVLSHWVPPTIPTNTQ